MKKKTRKKTGKKKVSKLVKKPCRDCDGGFDGSEHPHQQHVKLLKVRVTNIEEVEKTLAVLEERISLYKYSSYRETAKIVLCALVKRDGVRDAEQAGSLIRKSMMTAKLFEETFEAPRLPDMGLSQD